MRNQIIKEYAKQHPKEPGPRDDAAAYLATRIMGACRKVFKKPAKVMDFICALAQYLAHHNLPLRWTTPTP